MAINDVATFFDPICLEHRPGLGHPERPERLEAIKTHLDEYFGDLRLHSSNPADRRHIERVHDPDYVDRILALRGQSARIDPDTAVSPKSVDAALTAAGLAMASVESTIERNAPAFALVRPPGHHAEASQAMGFCLFNNIAVAAAYAIDELDVDRVLIVDWDVHHGNGTQNAFYDRRDVLFFSTHQSPLFPGTGEVDEIGRDHGAGYTINIPMPAGTGDAGLLRSMREILLPVARDFDPDLVLVSAGFDAHRDDPLAGMKVTTDGFGALTDVVRHIANEYAGGRLALILEGGYNTDALAYSVGRCIGSLQSSPAIPAPHDGHLPSPVSEALQRARRIHSRHWEIAS